MDMVSKLFLIKFVHVQKGFCFILATLDVVNFQNSFPMLNSEFAELKSFRLSFFSMNECMYNVLELILMKSVTVNYQCNANSFSYSRIFTVWIWV